MDLISLFGVAVGLSMDASTVAMANGASMKKVSLKDSFKIAFFFGMFQGVMPMIGLIIGKIGESIIASVDHWIAFILLGYIGASMIYGSIKNDSSYDNQYVSLKLITLLYLSLATSIDAMATGIILPSAIGADTIPLMLISALIIGLTTFFMSFAGVYIGNKFGCMLSAKAEILGGCILIIMALKILAEHIIGNV